MADYVGREVARERLRAACRGGRLVSVLVLLLGLCYAGIAAVVGTGFKLPFEFMYTFLYVVVPTMSDSMLALAECATKAALLVLVGFIGCLMFGKVAKTGEAFRAGQLKQLKFIAFLLTLLGFLPTVVGNALKVALALQSGGSALAVMSFAVEPMCILAGIVMFVAARVLVAGAQLGTQQEELFSSQPQGTVDPNPDFGDFPDLSNVPTAKADDVDATTKRPY